MKTHFPLALFLVIASSFMSTVSKAQYVYWPSLQEGNKHLITTKFGADYSSYYGLNYGYVLGNRRPVVLSAELSAPFGNEPLDDWKGRLSAQTIVWQKSALNIQLNPGFVARRYASPAATLVNLGADLNVTIGLSGERWGVAAFGHIDESLSTHATHHMLKEFYPEIRDGWYGSGGGNIKLGGIATYRIQSWNINLELGKIYAQNFKDNPTLPFQFELALQKVF